MKSVTVVLLFPICFLLACSSAPKPVVVTATSNVRNYNGTASVGDFLTISVDSVAHTIAYQNYTNGETGRVAYTVNADGSYTITIPRGTCYQPTKCLDT